MAIDAFSIYTTFIASIRSVGTACSMAMVGVYLHRRSFIIGEGKRTLALISQQVTIPFFLFSKIVYCNQDWSDAPCPDITSKMEDIWVLLFWPAYVVGWGLLVGYCAAWISGTPASQIRSVLAACAFGNSTGLPITLLITVHANFPDTTELGSVDPTLFLSVYLLLYPVLQWGVGGWLLAPREEETNTKDNGDPVDEPKSAQEETPTIESSLEDGTTPVSPTVTPTSPLIQRIKPVAPTMTPTSPRRRAASIGRNVLNNKEMLHHYEYLRRGIGETDASMYISNADLVQMASQYEMIPSSYPPNSPYYYTRGVAPPIPQSPDRGTTAPHPPKSDEHYSNSPDYQIQDYQEDPPSPPPSRTAYQRPHAAGNNSGTTPLLQSTETSLLLQHDKKKQQEDPTELSNRSCTSKASNFEAEQCWDVLLKIVSRCLQPPVIGAVLGLLVASTRLRGVFVDLERKSAAPLEWLFDAVYAVGQAAVPINMMILGCNLSASQLVKPGSASLLSTKTMTAIVIGKMVIMPIIGIATALMFDRYLWDIPDAINASFYLVCMIVFITPTANNVMVMVELSGSGTREGIAQVIAWQYAVAPVVLSLTMTIVVGVASEWS